MPPGEKSGAWAKRHRETGRQNPLLQTGKPAKQHRKPAKPDRNGGSRVKAGRIAIRCLIYVVGLELIGLGIIISVNSGLGVSPTSAVTYAVHETLLHHGITALSFGNVQILVFCSCLLAQILILRREFKWVNLLQLAVTTLAGFLLDVSRWVLGDAAIPGYAGRLLMIVIATVLIAVGILLFLSAKFVPMPPEGMYLAITQKQKRLPMHQIKIIGDCLFVVVAVAISWFGAGRIVGVREGTVILAVGVGWVMGFVGRWLNPLLGKLCFGAEAAAQMQDVEREEKELERL